MFTGNLNHYSSALQVFNARTGALVGNVALPNDGLPNPGLAVAPDSSRVYATFDSQTVSVHEEAQVVGSGFAGSGKKKTDVELVGFIVDRHGDGVVGPVSGALYLPILQEWQIPAKGTAGTRHLRASTRPRNP